MVELVRDRLKTLQVGNVGTELNAASKNAYLNLSEREMKSAIAIGDLIQKTRTFNGATIPNTGALAYTLADGPGTTDVRPPLGEAWSVSCVRIANLDPVASSTMVYALDDGTNTLNLFNGSIASGAYELWGLTKDSSGRGTPSLDLKITNALYLSFAQSGPSVATEIIVAYTKDVI
jgi:hypothetical protein